MHSLPVLLMALALLPLSVANTCLTEASFKGFPAGIQSKIDAELGNSQPPSNCAKDHCLTFATAFTDGKDTVTLTLKGCLHEDLVCYYSGACMDGKESVTLEGKTYTLSGAICCCIGANCRTPMPQPTPVKVDAKAMSDPKALLSSAVAPTATVLIPLAAVAALMAGGI